MARSWWRSTGLPSTSSRTPNVVACGNALESFFTDVKPLRLAADTNVAYLLSVQALEHLAFGVQALACLMCAFRSKLKLVLQTEAKDTLNTYNVAETALLECGIWLTSDAHLRAVDHQKLTLVLHQHELAPPVIATPREIVRKFFR